MIAKVVYMGECSNTYEGGRNRGYMGEYKMEVGDGYRACGVIGIVHEISADKSSSSINIFVRREETIVLAMSIPLHAVHRIYYSNHSLT